jgi:hypothetical protein
MREPLHTISGLVIGVRIDGGQLASSHSGAPRCGIRRCRGNSPVDLRVGLGWPPCIAPGAVVGLEARCSTPSSRSQARCATVSRPGPACRLRFRAAAGRAALIASTQCTRLARRHSGAADRTGAGGVRAIPARARAGRGRHSGARAAPAYRAHSRSSRSSDSNHSASGLPSGSMALTSTLELMRGNSWSPPISNRSSRSTGTRAQANGLRRPAPASGAGRSSAQVALRAGDGLALPRRHEGVAAQRVEDALRRARPAGRHAGRTRSARAAAGSAVCRPEHAHRQELGQRHVQRHAEAIGDPDAKPAWSGWKCVQTSASTGSPSEVLRDDALPQRFASCSVGSPVSTIVQPRRRAAARR